VKFKLANYLVKAKLPTPPKVIGHQAALTTGGKTLEGFNLAELKQDLNALA